jgi:uncharacterized Zn-finger protein
MATTKKAIKAINISSAELEARMAETKRKHPHVRMQVAYQNSRVHFIVIGSDNVKFRDSEFFTGFAYKGGGINRPRFAKPDNDEGMQAVVYFTLEEAHQAMTELLEWYASSDAIGYGYKQPAGLCITV